MGKHRGLSSRLRRLEHPPPSPREREAQRSRRELMERLERQYEELAAQRPEAAAEYIEAGRKLRAYTEEHEPDGVESSDPEVRREVRRLAKVAARAHERLTHGYTASTSGQCEDCGRGYDFRDGECPACGGVVTANGYLYKRIKTVGELKANIDACRRMGSETLAREYEGILERRLAEHG